MMKPHHLPHLLPKPRLGIGDQLAPKCGISRFHISAPASHKLFLIKWKASNSVNFLKKIAPHYAVEEQC